MAKFWKTFLPIGWLYGEYVDLKNFNKSMLDAIKRLFIKEAPERKESFEQAMTRLNLTNDDVIRTARNYRWYAIIFLLLGIILFSYAFYLLFAYFSITGWLLALGATTLCLTYAFRFDFWAYQMRMRKLGVTANEWLQSILGGKGSSI